MRSSRTAVLLALLLGFFGSLSEDAICQEPAVEEAEPEEPADGDASKPLERLIYVPYRNLKAALDRVDGTIFLPYAEYLELLKRAGDPKRERPPVGAVVTEAAYTGRVAENHVRITAEYEVEALDGPWAEVVVPFGDAAVSELRTEGEKKALLRGLGEGRYALLLPEKGAYTVEVDLVQRVRSTPEGRTFSLTVPKTAITTFELAVPEANQEIEIEPGGVELTDEDAEVEPVAEPEAEDEQNVTRVRASLGATQRITATWSPEAGAKPDMDLLASVENALQVSLADRVIQSRAVLRYRILRGELEQVRVVVPKGHRVLDVVAPETRLKGWSTEEEENRQVVTVDLLAPATGGLTLEVRTEGTLPEDTFAPAGIDADGAVHGIHAVDVVRESGTLALVPERETTLTVAESSGLVRIEAVDVDESLRVARADYFRFFDPRFRLRVFVEPIEPRIVADTHTRVVLREDRIETTVTAGETIDRAGVFERRWSIPDGHTLLDVQCPRMKEFTFDEETRVLRIALAERSQGALQTTITTRRDFDADEPVGQLSLQVPEPLDVFRETGRLDVYAIPGLAVRTNEDALENLVPEPVSERPAVNDAVIVSSWSFTRRPIELSVSTERRPTRLSARIGTRLDVRRDIGRVTSRIEYLVEYSGVRTFRFAVPEAIVDKLEVTTESGDAVDWKPEAAAEGWTPIRVLLPGDVVGRHVFELTYDVNPTAAGDGDDAEADEDAEENVEMLFTLQPPRMLGLPDEEGEDDAVPVTELRGEVTVSKERTLAVSARIEGAGEDAEAIDVRELEVLPGDEAFLAFRYVAQPVTVHVTATTHDVEEVVETVATRSLLEVVVGRDGRANYRCRYRLVSSERQRLPLWMPVGAEVLGVFVGDRSVDLERNAEASPPEGWEAFAVDVSRQGGSDEPFVLTIQFRLPLAPRPFESVGGRLKLAVPQLGGAARGTVAVQRTRAVVWVPDDYVLVGAPTGFDVERTPQSPFLPISPHPPVKVNELDGWIGGGAAGIFEFPREGRPYAYTGVGGTESLALQWWDLPLVTWILSGTILLIALVLRNTGWENKLAVLLIATLIVLAYGLRDAVTVRHLWVAARIGVLALLALWLLHGIASLGRNKRTRIGRPRPLREPVAVVVPPPGLFEDRNKDSEAGR